MEKDYYEEIKRIHTEYNQIEEHDAIKLYLNGLGINAVSVDYAARDIWVFLNALDAELLKDKTTPDPVKEWTITEFVKSAVNSIVKDALYISNHFEGIEDEV